MKIVCQLNDINLKACITDFFEWLLVPVMCAHVYNKSVSTTSQQRHHRLTQCHVIQHKNTRFGVSKNLLPSNKNSLAGDINFALH